MLSDSCSFHEFINKVEPEDMLDLMYLTEKEATEAERCRYRSHVAAEKKENCGYYYAETLKNFLFFMRYSLRPTGIDDELYEAFCSACKKFCSNSQTVH